VADADRVHAARVLVVGVGGLGCPAALALARAGVGTIGLIDGDVVDPSNLPRQIVYRDADIGQPKAAVAAARLGARAPGTRFEVFAEPLTGTNAATILGMFQVIIDGTDQVSAKYLVNDAAVDAGLPFVHAGVVGFEGQLLTVLPHQTACVRCLFPVPPREGEVPTCQETGVLGPLAGTMGTLQAGEAVRYLLGWPVGNRLLTYDATRLRWRTIRLERRRDCPACSDLRPSAAIPGAGSERCPA